MKSLQLTDFGHIMRANSLEKSSVSEEGHWLDTIKSDTNMNFKQLKKAVLDGTAWRMLVHKVAESQIRLNG